MSKKNNNVDNWRKFTVADISDEDISGPKIDRRTSLKIFSAIGMGGLAGCSDSSSGTSPEQNDDDSDSANSPRSGGSVTVGWVTDELGNLDAHNSANPHSLKALSLIHNGLLKLSANNEIVGDIAEDWSVDGSKWEFSLHEGVKFHNGDDFTASHMVESVKLLMDNEESPHRSKTDAVIRDSLSAPDPTTFTFETETPVAAMPAYLTLSPGRAFVSLHPGALSEDPERFRRFPVGTGPFQVAENEQGNQIVLESFDDYWETDDEGNQLPYLDSVTIDLLPEATTVWSGMQAGRIHYTPDITAEFADRIESNDNFKLNRTNPAAWRSLCFLCEPPHEHPNWASNAGGYPPEKTTDVWKGKDIPTTDPQVRRALSMAIDRERLAEVGWLGLAEPAHSPWNPIIPWAQEAAKEVVDPETSSQHYNPEQAKELLDEAGYTGSPRLTATLIAMPPRQRPATVIQEMYRQIDVEIELQILQSSDWFDTSYSFTTMIDAYEGDLDIDPGQTVNNQLHTPDDTGYGVWSKNLYSNEEFDQVLEEAATLTDQSERVEAVKKMTHILDEDAPYAWTVFPYDPAVRASSLKGVQSPVGMVVLTAAWLDE